MVGSARKIGATSRPAMPDSMRAEREGHRDGAVDGNADQPRGVQVLRGGLHQDAEPAFWSAARNCSSRITASVAKMNS